MLYFNSFLKLMHDVYNKKTPANISNLFTPVQNTGFLSTKNFFVRNSNVNNFKNSFSRAGSEYGIVFLITCVILIKEDLRKKCKKIYFLKNI